MTHSTNEIEEKPNNLFSVEKFIKQNFPLSLVLLYKCLWLSVYHFDIKIMFINCL